MPAWIPFRINMRRAQLPLQNSGQKARVHSPTMRMRLFLVRSSPLPKERYALFAIGRCEAAKSKNPSYQSEPETDAQHPKAALW